MSTVITTVEREPIKIVADILKTELGLPNGQIMLAYEKWIIPPTETLYAWLTYVAPSTVIGNNNYSVPTNTGMDEIQEVAMRHIIQIDMMSFNGEARARKEEVPMALGSVYSQQQQEKYLIQIARMNSGFIDTSFLEETKMLNRFTTTIAVMALHRKVKSAPYFDTFQGPDVTVNI